LFSLSKTAKRNRSEKVKVTHCTELDGVTVILTAQSNQGTYQQDAVGSPSKVLCHYTVGQHEL